MKREQETRGSITALAAASLALALLALLGGLNPVYGCCVIALTASQPSLPPGWLGGDRIAIHAWKGPVGPAGSTGCLRGALLERVSSGTPVFIRA